MYCGEDYVYCEDCGLLFRNSNTKPAKKCPTCRKYDPVEPRKFICVDCGEEFLSVCRGNIPMRCDDCKDIHISEYKKLKYKPVGTKTIVCKDCGEEFEGKRSIRCEECKLKERRRVSRECNNKRRHNIV